MVRQSTEIYGTATKKATRMTSYGGFMVRYVHVYLSTIVNR